MLDIFLAIPVQLKATPITTMFPVVESTESAGFKSGMGLFIFALVIGFAIFWVWSLISLLSNKFLSGTTKVFWFLVVFFLPFLGSLLYFFIGNKRK